MSKLISAIIVSFNSEQFIEACINSCLKYLPSDSEIIVLDNSSVDKTVSILKKFLPKIKLIVENKNLGFGAGNNLVVKEAEGEFLLLLNPDTKLVEPIDELVKFYRQTDAIGVAGPKLIMPNGEIQPSVRSLPSAWRAFKEYILRINNSYSQYVPEGENPTEVECIYGAAILIKKDLYERLGGFDEKYFLYYEDIDLCRRVKNLGKKVYYYPKVKVKHLVGATYSDQDKYLLNLASAKIYHGAFIVFFLQLIFKIGKLLRKSNF